MNEKLEKLFSKFEQLDLTHMFYEDDEFTLELGNTKQENVSLPSAEDKVVSQTTKDSTIVDNSPKEADDSKEIKSQSQLKEIKSPLVGTFYRKMDPGEDDLVTIGQRVEQDEVVCVVEAMKMFNEITSPYDGVVKEINFKDGDFVEFDDTLIVIE